MKCNSRIVFLSIFNIINIAWIVFLLVVSIINDIINRYFLYLTLLNFISCTIYLCMITIYEMTENEEAFFYKFLVHRISKCVFSTCFTVVLGYWTLTAMGDDVMHWIDSLYFLIMTLYLHLYIGVLIVIEFFSNKQRFYVKGFYWGDLIKLTILLIIYMIVLLSVSKSFELYIYDFLKKPLINALGYCLMMVVYFFAGYNIFYSLYRQNHQGHVEYSDLISNEKFYYEKLTINEEKFSKL